MSNPTKIYNDYVRANLPNTMTFNSSTARYNINNHSFFSFNRANWYFKYITKYGYISLSAYAVNNFDPDLVFDFKQNYYRTGGTGTTLSPAVTHARAGQATMVDSDGLLKWSPHNLLTHSGDLTNAGWNDSNVTVTAGQNNFEGNPTAFKMTPTASSGVHRLYKTTANSNLSSGILTTVTIDVKADGYNFFTIAHHFNTYVIINLSDGTVALNVNSVSPTVTSLGNGWYRCSVTSSAGTQEVFSVGETSTSSSFGSQTFTGDGTSGVLVAYPHAYRSDLGGMVNNPTTSNSYVPTTSSAVYAPRVGHHVYNGSAWVNEGILHESEARTNAISTSEVAPTAYSSGITKSVDSSVVSPAGGNNVEKFTLSSSNERHFVGNHNPISASSGTSTYSIFAKGSGHNLIRLGMNNTAGRFYCDFNLSTGQKQVTSISDSSVIGAIESMGNGWWRCSMTYASEKTNPYATVSLINAMDAPLLNPFLGDGTSGVYVWGSQYEVGSTPSSYIPTSGSAVTRAAETLTVPAANLPYSSTNMSIQIDGRMTYADQDEFSAHQFMRWRASGSDNIASAGGTNTGDGLRVLFQQVAGGVNDTIPTGVVYNEGILVPFNLSSRHGSTFINGATDGTALTADTTPVALPDLSTTNLELGYDFMGTIAQFRMWDEDLGDTGIAEAST